MSLLLCSLLGGHRDRHISKSTRMPSRMDTVEVEAVRDLSFDNNSHCALRHHAVHILSDMLQTLDDA